MTMTPAEMDELLDRHYAAEMAQDLDVLLATLADDAVHDVAGDPQGALRGRDIATRYKTLFDDLKITGLRPLRRLHGPDFLVDEVVCQADAVGQPFGIEGGGRRSSSGCSTSWRWARGRSRARRCGWTCRPSSPN
jgi:ketosteroid isomerase-like protein